MADRPLDASEPTAEEHTIRAGVPTRAVERLVYAGSGSPCLVCESAPGGHAGVHHLRTGFNTSGEEVGACAEW